MEAERRSARAEGNAVSPIEPLVQSRSEIPLGTVLGRRYRIEASLGSGGMGSVFLAYDLQMSRPVALKALAPTWAADPGIAGRFLAEGRVMASLNRSNTHPNVVSVFDCGTAEAGQACRVTRSRDAAGMRAGDGEPTYTPECAQPYIVMERLEGETLSQRLGDLQPQRLDLATVLEVVEQVLVALEVPHQHGIIHRDIKPSNIFIEQELGSTGGRRDRRDRNGRLQLKLLDFGIAVGATTEHGLPLSETAGTPEYMSPEQAEGHASPPSDFYSVGIVMYEMLSGAPPFKSPAGTGQSARLAAAFEVVKRHLNEPIAPLWTIPSATPISSELSWFLDRLLAKQASERFQSASEAIAEFQIARQAEARAIAGEPTLSVPALSKLGAKEPTASSSKPSAEPQNNRAPPRNWRPLLMGVGLVVAAVGGIWAIHEATNSPEATGQEESVAVDLSTAAAPPVVTPEDSAAAQQGAAQEATDELSKQNPASQGDAMPPLPAPKRAAETPPKTVNAPSARTQRAAAVAPSPCSFNYNLREYARRTRAALHELPNGDSDKFEALTEDLGTAIVNEDCQSVKKTLGAMRQLVGVKAK